MPDTLIMQQNNREKKQAIRHATIALAGNPNCGKTTLFNALTGLKQKTGNWPGVTVERKTGSFMHENVAVEVVDLPGVYSLTSASVDEEVTREYILSGDPDMVVNIVDASNLERNLYLTSRLIEMRVPVILALNMMDSAEERGLHIDLQQLEKLLGCRVIPLVASKEKGIDALKIAIYQELLDPRKPETSVTFEEALEKAADRLAGSLALDSKAGESDPRWLALKLLEGDAHAEKIAGTTASSLAAELRRNVQDTLDEDADILIADGHYRFIGEVIRKTVEQASDTKESLSDRIDRVVLSKGWGIPIFLLAMYAMFMFTINLGGAFIDFFDIFAGTIFVDGLAIMLESVGAPVWLVTLLAAGLGGSIQTMATFIPPIAFMFFFLSILEDSGYMARAAFVMDRAMRFIGLPGKAFVPLLVGFGCTVPAIMGTRTLEYRRDRLMAVMMAPFMSCGARLPVYALFAAAFFPVGGQNIVFLLYLTGILFAVITGLVLKNTLLKGEASPFLMELPPYHIPTIKGIMTRTWERLQTFLVRAGKILVPLIVVLSFLNSLGTDGSFGNEDTEQSVLSSIGKTITPAFTPMGITEENWPATVGIFTGIFAKEAVVGTLNALYIGIDEASLDEEDAGGFDLAGGIQEAFATIPENLSGVLGTFTDPLGITLGETADLEVAAEEQEVDTAIFGSMVHLFQGQAGAFAYLLFVLLYFPCSAAIAAVYRETTLGWTLFAGLWTTGLAYAAAVVYFQLANFGTDPATALSWTGLMVALFAGAVAVMWFMGKKPQGT
ncbi:Fe(2+) transporter permease subunit FeoB [Prosthecochloris vibrioformis]|uniref:Ferrous iron transport protein B n=1 Tax=Prosthecochloris vibrioformis TaxID=1098 RepID=A0A5C4S247_PROVB|nr:Fe(2+) transporter permease subunit FeoB [Prosthecochloris vibrioformis]TNJ37238.1 Fe(2+) transporter permease subunit FeoB [Prosthecochloris vibrioformis]